MEHLKSFIVQLTIEGDQERIDIYTAEATVFIANDDCKFTATEIMMVAYYSQCRCDDKLFTTSVLIGRR